MRTERALKHDLNANPLLSLANAPEKNVQVYVFAPRQLPNVSFGVCLWHFPPIGKELGVPSQSESAVSGSKHPPEGRTLDGYFLPWRPTKQTILERFGFNRKRFWVNWRDILRVFLRQQRRFAANWRRTRWLQNETPSKATKQDKFTLLRISGHYHTTVDLDHSSLPFKSKIWL